MSDKIPVSCPNCQKKLAVPSSAAGKRIRCPGCQGAVKVPGTASPAKKDVSAKAPVSNRPRQPSTKRSSSSAASAAGATPTKKKRPAAPVKAAQKQRPAKKTRRPAASDPYADDLYGDSYGDSYDDSYGDSAEASGMPPRRRKGNKPASIGRNERPAKSSSQSSGFGAERAKILLTGFGMMAIAIVWFVIGWQAGYIYFYPPVLLVLGIVRVIQGALAS